MAQTAEFVELIPGLPEELALECLTRLHYSVHGVAFSVCKRWLGLLQSRDFYYHRRNSGQTRKVACLVQALPVPSEAKPTGPPSYGISVFDPASGTWDRVDPIPKYPNGLPLFCQIASTEGKLFVLGGWDPSSWEPVKDVFKYEFTTRRWTQCADMPSARSFFAVGASEGRIYIAGGHDESKNALNSAWVLDVKGNKWTELPRMSEERDECEGVVIGSQFWVVSGYDTESQGGFKSSAEERDECEGVLIGSQFWVVSGYDTESQGGFKSSAEVYEGRTGKWRRVEEAWRGSECPRSCVWVGENGEMRSWAECEAAVGVGTCGVDLGDVTLVTGSPYQGATHGFFIAEKRYENNNNSNSKSGKLRKLEVAEEFSGFVQSGCFVEI